MRLSTLSVAILILSSFTEQQQKIIAEAKQKFDKKKTTLIKGPCAIIVRPDDRKIELLKRKNSNDEYVTVVDDNQYYIGTSIGLLTAENQRLAK